MSQYALLAECAPKRRGKVAPYNLHKSSGENDVCHYHARQLVEGRVREPDNRAEYTNGESTVARRGNKQSPWIQKPTGR